MTECLRLRSETSQGCLTFLFNNVLEVLSSEIKQEKKMHTELKKERKLPLFADDFL